MASCQTSCLVPAARASFTRSSAKTSSKSPPPTPPAIHRRRYLLQYSSNSQAFEEGQTKERHIHSCRLVVEIRCQHSLSRNEMESSFPYLSSLRNSLLVFSGFRLH